MRNDRAGLPPAMALRDLIVVLGVTALSFVIAAELDLAERLSGWTGTHEWVELDEATIVLAVLVVGLSLFSLLRWSERRRDLQGDPPSSRGTASWSSGYPRSPTCGT